MRRDDSLEKTLMLGGIGGRKRRGWQMVRWLDGITDSMDVSLSELREFVMDRAAWHVVIHGVAKSHTQLCDWTELNWSHFSCVQLFVTLWTLAHQATLPMDSPGKNTGVGFHALLQRIFPTQRSNLCLLCLLHWEAGSLPLAPPEKLSLIIRERQVKIIKCYHLTTVRRVISKKTGEDQS